MVLRTGVSLAAQPGRLLAGLSFVVGQHVRGVLPLGVVVEEVALLVQRVWSHSVLVALAVLESLKFSAGGTRRGGLVN